MSDWTMEPHTTLDKRFKIEGPGDLTLYVDYDDVDHRQVDAAAHILVDTMNSLGSSREVAEETKDEAARDLKMDPETLRLAFFTWLNADPAKGYGCVHPALTPEQNAACYAIYRVTKLKSALRSCFKTLERRDFAPVPEQRAHAREALLRYMEWWSQSHYSAVWISSLPEELEERGDETYLWLKSVAGGTWHRHDKFVEARDD